MRILEHDTLIVQRTDWLKDLPNLQCQNEIEVEVKVVHPMVHFLGYHARNIRLRYPAPWRYGRQEVQGEADWVLFRDPPGEMASPFLVIEAKAADVTLDTEVQEQARSYAVALRTPFYMLTNGRHFKLYRFELAGDQCLLDCSAEQLANHWTILEQWVACGASGISSGIKEEQS